MPVFFLYYRRIRILFCPELTRGIHSCIIYTINNAITADKRGETANEYADQRGGKDPYGTGARQ